MTKTKSEPVTAIALLGKNTQTIASSVVDLKVSKSDLFDLVIHEADTELATELEAADKASSVTRDALYEATQELGRKAAAKTVEALVAASRTPGLKTLFSDGVKPEISVESNTRNDDGPVLSYSVSFGKEPSYYGTTPTAYMRVKGIAVKMTAPVLKLHQANEDAQKKVGGLRSELHRLRSETKKMKVQVVRSILDSSSEGRTILSGLDQMKRAFRAERRKALANS